MHLDDLLAERKKLIKKIYDIDKEIETMNSIDAVQKLEDIPDHEKIVSFDELYKLCEDNVKHVIEHGYEMKDIKQWIYEMAINMTLGENAWPIINTSDSPY